MKKCEMLEGCRFFNDKMEKMPTTSSIYKQTYCLGDNSQCARYKVATKIGREYVTDEICPEDVDKARSLISKIRTEHLLSK